MEHMPLGTLLFLSDFIVFSVKWGQQSYIKGADGWVGTWKLEPSGLHSWLPSGITWGALQTPDTWVPALGIWMSLVFVVTWTLGVFKAPS